MAGFLDTPTWRWRRAVELVDEQARPSRLDDEVTVRAFKFLKRKRSANTTRMKMLQANYPDVYAANKIYEEEDMDRWMLEAALCAPVSHEQIAQDNVIENPKIITTYAELFFDVQNYLNSPMYVHKYILRPALRNRTMEESSPDFTYKLVALTLGYDALLDSWKIGHDSPEQTKLAMMAKDNRLRQLGVEAAFTAPVNKYTSLELIDRANAIDERTEARSGGTRDAAVEAVHELIQSVTFRLRTPEDRKILGPDGLEPRALENMEPDQEAEEPR